MRGRLAQWLLSAGVLALGIGAALTTARLPGAGGYSGIGPNFMPAVVSGGLILCGLWLLAEVATGGWRRAAPDDPAERGEHAFYAPGFLWVTAGLFAHMVLINRAGFVIAATVLFVLVARGFGSVRPLRDAAIGGAIALAIFLFFVRFLNVNLPAGWLHPLLGGAGI
ncbi:MAG TPA: tripartite tricarboxylate transporter TctB family protein [Burkholderiaceae bacterium]|jgi:putative tricarboxylic transport membrane protein|nr:tripartite tricarboxylate transporter TctB family protein [Burkholderiaceae bacterium]